MVLLVPMAMLWAFLPNDGIALVLNWFMDTVVVIMVELPFSRDMETEADRVGLILAAKVKQIWFIVSWLLIVRTSREV